MYVSGSADDQIRPEWGSRRRIGYWASSRLSFLAPVMRASSQSMQLRLRRLVSKAFDVACWVIIHTLSGVQVASNKFWLSERQWAVIEI